MWFDLTQCMMNQDVKEMMNQVGNTDTIAQFQHDPNSLEVFFLFDFHSLISSLCFFLA